MYKFEIGKQIKYLFADFDSYLIFTVLRIEINHSQFHQ